MRYSETIKEILCNCIDSESKCKDNFRIPEIDFSRTRKLTFSDTFKIILPMGGNTLKKNYSSILIIH